MIPFDFDYYRPETLEEAVHLFKTLDGRGKAPLYYGGGSEIISLARVHNLHTQAVIDLKAIPECNVLEFRGELLILGASVTLSRISESKLFPLLGKAGGRIADHTMQCRITLGGNIGGTILYREAVLPLLLSDGCALVASGDKLKQLPLQEIFKERLELPKGEFVVQFIVRKEYTALPYVHVKKTKNEKIDYPLVSVAAVRKDGGIRLAMSGVCAFPFRSARVEECLNEPQTSREARAEKAVGSLPAPVLNDVLGSEGYRRFVLKNTLVNTLKVLEEEQPC